MARPKRKRGFRRIHVNGVEFRWRFEPSTPNSRLRVSHATVKGQTLVVRMVGWVGPWLGINGFSIVDGVLQLYTSAKNEPPIVTGRFARQCIVFALEHGWQPETPGSDFRVVSHNGVLRLPEN
jgi:hypothetical protein